jgi:hypothetical protein
MKYHSFFIISLICLLAFSPLETFAQTTGSIYNPVSSSDTKKTFSGTSFSSVGGAIAGCANAGGLIVNGAAKLFNKIKASGTSAVPTNDAQANRVTQCLNGIAYSIAKNLLQQLSTKTLNWVNKGLGGNPLYVQDIGSNLRTIRDEQLGRYLDTVQTSNPIFGNAIRSAVTRQVTGISDGYINKAMNTPEGKKYTEFQSDFTSGGWDSFLTMDNNPIGALFNSTDRIAQQIVATQTERIDEVQRNNGFLDMRTCVEYAPIKLSGSGICKDNGIPMDELPPDTDCPSGAIPSTTPPKTPQCLKYKTVTPGQLISQQASNVLGSSQKQLELADSINEVLGSFFDQLLNNLYQKGIAGLQTRGGGSNNIGGYGNNVVLGSNGLPLSSGAADAFGYQALNTGYDVQDFDISRPQQLRAIIQAQYNFKNKATDSKIAMDAIVPTLGALDYCIPGPNPTWRDSLSDNYQSFIGSLETPSKNRPAILNIVNNIPVIGGLLGSIFGSGSTDIQYALVGQASLLDKTTGNSVAISPWSYLYYTKDYDRGVKNTDGDWIRGFIDAGYTRLIPKYQTNFSDASIIGLFTAVDPNTAYATGAIKDSIKETAKLISYNQSLSPLDDDYSQAISDTDDALTELESIRKEELDIVKTAKARYIAERAAAGNPVNMTCLNAAYVVDQSPITGVARQESDTPNPMIQQSKDASDYFYSNL